MFGNIKRWAILLGSVGVIVITQLSSSVVSWSMDATPATIAFEAIQGSINPPSRTVNVFKPSGRSTTWSVTDNATWLRVTPEGGLITHTAQMAVFVNTASLAVGTYKAWVTIKVDRGASVSVRVVLKVIPSSKGASSPSAPSSSTASPSISPVPGDGGAPASAPIPSSSGLRTTALLSWDASAAQDLAGYNVYVGTAPGVYGSPIRIGRVTSYAVTDLPLGNTIYFAVTALDNSNNESLPSAEASKSIY